MPEKYKTKPEEDLSAKKPTQDKNKLLSSTLEA